MCRKSGVVVVLGTERSDVMCTVSLRREKENLLRFIVACANVDWDYRPASKQPPNNISSFLVCFLYVCADTDCSQGKQRTVLRRCAGVKTKIILNASMDLKKRNTNSRFSRKRNGEKVLERNLTSIRTRRKMTFTQKALMPNESERKRELRNKKGLLMDVIFHLVECSWAHVFSRWGSTENEMIDHSFVRSKW